MQSTTLWILIAVLIAAAVVVLIIGAAAIMRRRRRSAQLRQQFGPEYERAVATRGDTGAAERELSDREEQRRGVQLRPLGPVEQRRLADSWTVVQEQFVDEPRESLRRADQLVSSAMRQRGYPASDFEETAGTVSVDHPEEVTEYRRAHAVATGTDGATTEQMRVAMQQYRNLFDSLVGGGAQGDTTAGSAGARQEARAAR